MERYGVPASRESPLNGGKKGKNREREREKERKGEKKEKKIEKEVIGREFRSCGN
jgi:hypothetical protein